MDNSHIRALRRLSSIRNVDEDRLVAYFPVLCPAIFQYHTTTYFNCKKEDVSIPAYHLASCAIPRNDTTYHPIGCTPVELSMRVSSQKSKPQDV